MVKFTHTTSCSSHHFSLTKKVDIGYLMFKRLKSAMHNLEVGFTAHTNWIIHLNMEEFFFCFNILWINMKLCMVNIFKVNYICHWTHRRQKHVLNTLLETKQVLAKYLKNCLVEQVRTWTVETARIQILVLPHRSHAALIKLFHLSVLQFPHL